MVLKIGVDIMNIIIKKMGIAEHLQTMEELWNSILYEGSEIETPEWHRGVVEERKRKMKNGKAEFISIDKLKAMYK
ncbi:MAG: addiction module protein [Actinobacteria bacterium]|nr:addiction module protein [Actinomycetota bacterium]